MSAGVVRRGASGARRTSHTRRPEPTAMRSIEIGAVRSRAEWREALFGESGAEARVFSGRSEACARRSCAARGEAVAPTGPPPPADPSLRSEPIATRFDAT